MLIQDCVYDTVVTKWSSPTTLQFSSSRDKNKQNCLCTTAGCHLCHVKPEQAISVKTSPSQRGFNHTTTSQQTLSIVRWLPTRFFAPIKTFCSPRVSFQRTNTTPTPASAATCHINPFTKPPSFDTLSQLPYLLTLSFPHASKVCLAEKLPMLASSSLTTHRRFLTHNVYPPYSYLPWGRSQYPLVQRQPHTLSRVLHLPQATILTSKVPEILLASMLACN